MSECVKTLSESYLRVLKFVFDENLKGEKPSLYAIEKAFRSKRFIDQNVLPLLERCELIHVERIDKRKYHTVTLLGLLVLLFRYVEQALDSVDGEDPHVRILVATLVHDLVSPFAILLPHLASQLYHLNEFFEALDLLLFRIRVRCNCLFAELEKELKNLDPSEMRDIITEHSTLTLAMLRLSSQILGSIFAEQPCDPKTFSELTTLIDTYINKIRNRVVNKDLENAIENLAKIMNILASALCTERVDRRSSEDPRH